MHRGPQGMLHKKRLPEGSLKKVPLAARKNELLVQIPSWVRRAVHEVVFRRRVVDTLWVDCGLTSRAMSTREPLTTRGALLTSATTRVWSMMAGMLMA